MTDQIFIAGGSSRSGTTLLRLMLSAHPDICISPETKSLEKILCDYHPNKALTGPGLEDLKEAILKDQKLRSWKIDLDQYYEEVKAYKHITPKEIAIRMMSCFKDALSPEARILGNKKGFYLDQYETVRAVFPNSKFLFIVRDARDAIASIIANIDQYDLQSATKVWCSRVRLARDIVARFPDHSMLIQYENLVLYPEATSREICQFLEVSYTDTMLHFYQENKTMGHILQGQENIHLYTSQPITQERIGIWKSRLSEEEISFIEGHTSDLLNDFGYQRHSLPERVYE